MKSSKNKSKVKKRISRIQLGAPPGTIALEPGGPKSEVQIIGFGPNGFVEKKIETLDEIAPIRTAWPVVWIHVTGIGDIKALSGLQKLFSLHNLAVEDVVNQNQRPKMEPYDEHDYLVLFSAEMQESLAFRQVNLFLGNGFVVSIAETPGDWEEPVRRRIREGRARLKNLGAGYLAYTLMDAVVDHYFPIMDNIAEKLDVLEESALAAPGRAEIVRIHHMSSLLLSLRRTLAPLKDMLHSLVQTDHEFIGDNIRIYFRDCYDHTAQLLDEIDMDREIARSLVNISLSSISNRMNEIMKVLTVITTIFIPLSFIAGIYGMNFDTQISPFNMPELRWSFGYPFVLLLMLTVSGSLLLYFHRKGWFDSGDKES